MIKFSVLTGVILLGMAAMATAHAGDAVAGQKLFGTTCIAIFSLLAWNLIGHHAVNYADSYLYVGFPAGVLALIIALPVFGGFWVRARLQNK